MGGGGDPGYDFRETDILSVANLLALFSIVSTELGFLSFSFAPVLVPAVTAEFLGSMTVLASVYFLSQMPQTTRLLRPISPACPPPQKKGS